MPVHIYGHPCDMQPIWELAGKYHLKIVEDAAEVHGAEYRGKKCGALGDIAAFSFFANKIATTGEGGMVLTNDGALAEKCRYRKNLCFPLGGNRTYQHNDIGFNYRMSNLHAAIGLAQVERLDHYVEARRRVNDLYKKYLNDVLGITLQPEKEWAKNVYWMNGLVVDQSCLGMSRDELMSKLKEMGIDTRLFFSGMHAQKSLKQYGCHMRGDYTVTEWLSENGMYLPSSSGLCDEDIRYVCDAIANIGMSKRK